MNPQDFQLFTRIAKALERIADNLDQAERERACMLEHGCTECALCNEMDMCTCGHQRHLHGTQPDDGCEARDNGVPCKCIRFTPPRSRPKHANTASLDEWRDASSHAPSDPRG